MSGNLKKEILPIYISNVQQQFDCFHQDAELFYVLEGSMEIAMGDYHTHLKHEDIFIVNSNRGYSYKASKDVLFVRVSIPYQIVSSMVKSTDVVFLCDSTRDENRQYDILRRLFKKLLNRYYSVRDRENDFGYKALCYQVLDILSTHFLLRITDQGDSDERERFDERIVQINNYIHANYSHPISSKDLADKLHLSQSYLSRFFKKTYGMSFTEYLTNIRLYHAMDDLLYTNTPITRIAFDNGFANIAALTKVFKDSYGETPSSMRKNQKNKAQGAEPADNSPVVKQRLENYLRSSGEEQELIPENNDQTENCSVAASQPLVGFWGDTINIGAASDLLKSEVRDHIIMLKELLGFRYVRFWNIFSEEMFIQPTVETDDYNFSKLDAIIDFLLEHELKPYIELGMKPKRLYRDVQNAIIEERHNIYHIEVPAYRKVISAMMRHFHNRYRRSELNTWRMELWFHEDQWGKKGAAERYFERFEVIYETVKQYADHLEVGGCGLRIGFSDIESQTLPFLRQWSEQNCLPDFISVLYYPYERGEVNQDRYSRRSSDNEGMMHKVAVMREIMGKAGMSRTKLYITEWNLTVSDRNYINDTCFKGAYIVKNIIDNYGQLDLLAYFFGSDRVSEYFDSRGLLHGGSGLISKDGILKPAGYAFRFLSWLYNYFVVKGKNFIVTTDGHDSYAIVCHNQKALNYNYYLTREDEIPKDSIWKYFEDQESLHLNLQLKDVKNGKYQVKTYQINEKIGSPIHFWAEMGFETELSRKDIAYLQRVCGPRLTIRTEQASEHTLPIVCNMKANEFCFIRVRKLS